MHGLMQELSAKKHRFLQKRPNSGRGSSKSKLSRRIIDEEAESSKTALDHLKFSSPASQANQMNVSELLSLRNSKARKGPVRDNPSEPQVLVRIDKEGKVRYEITEFKRGCSTCRSFKEVEVDPSQRVQTKPPI